MPRRLREFPGRPDLARAHARSHRGEFVRPFDVQWAPPEAPPPLVASVSAGVLTVSGGVPHYRILGSVQSVTMEGWPGEYPVELGQVITIRDLAGQEVTVDAPAPVVQVESPSIVADPSWITASITCATPGATIWFLVYDGIWGDFADYDGPIGLHGEATTIYAFATKDGMADSELVGVTLLRARTAVRLWGDLNAGSLWATLTTGAVVSFPIPAATVAWTDQAVGAVYGLYDRTAKRFRQIAGGVDRVLPGAPDLPADDYGGRCSVYSIAHDWVAMASWDDDTTLRVRRWQDGVLASEVAIPIVSPEFGAGAMVRGTTNLHLAMIGSRLLLSWAQRLPSDAWQEACLAHSDDYGTTWTRDRCDAGTGGGASPYRHIPVLFTHLGKAWSYLVQRGLGHPDLLVSDDGATWTAVPSPHAYQWLVAVAPTAHGVAVVEGTGSWGNLYGVNADRTSMAIPGADSFAGSVLSYYDGDIYDGAPGESGRRRLDYDAEAVTDGAVPANASTVWALLSNPVAIPV